MKIACKTDMGRTREINEDNFAYLDIKGNRILLIVADGMGGHNAGEVASKIAVNSVMDYIKANIKDIINSSEVIELLKESIQKANSDIYKESINNSGCSGMGTTITAAFIYSGHVCIGHVGDSRAYIFKDGKLCMITNDHSLVAELLKNGTITEMEAQHHPQKNIITRALGTADDVEVDIELAQIDEGDIILLCTDGLTNMVCDEEIEEYLSDNTDVDAAASKLVNRANQLGGYDNITVIIGKAADTDSEVEQ